MIKTRLNVNKICVWNLYESLEKSARIRLKQIILNIDYLHGLWMRYQCPHGFTGWPVEYWLTKQSMFDLPLQYET